MYSNHLLTAVHETVMLFLKPDVKKILLFTVCFVSLVTHRQ